MIRARPYWSQQLQCNLKYYFRRQRKFNDVPPLVVFIRTSAPVTVFSSGQSQGDVHMPRERGARLPSKAWNAIEAADLDELAFLHGVLCVNAMRWEIHLAIRAVLEHLALRRL